MAPVIALKAFFSAALILAFCFPVHVEQKGGALDHIVVSTGMQEAAVSAVVSGYCDVLNCEQVSGAMPAAFQRLSDHCPVIVEIKDEDHD